MHREFHLVDGLSRTTDIDRRPRWPATTSGAERLDQREAGVQARLVGVAVEEASDACGRPVRRTRVVGVRPTGGVPGRQAVADRRSISVQKPGRATDGRRLSWPGTVTPAYRRAPARRRV
jgi:hypothetical protein